MSPGAPTGGVGTPFGRRGTFRMLHRTPNQTVTRFSIKRRSIQKANVLQGDTMNTRTVPARLRGVFVAVACLAATLAAPAALAQQCPPQANIQSVQQQVNEGVTVSPNGQSSKPNNATYLWERVSGPAITWIPNATVAHPDFVAPQVTGDQQLVIRLTVTGCSPVSSHSTTSTITIRDLTAPPSNTAPTANPVANPPIAGEGVTVTLDGSTSTDPENNPLTYAWSQTDGPTVTLANANAAQATFVAPNLSNPAGETLTFKLRVTDPGGLFNEKTVVVNVLFANDSPFASLHCPLIVDEGDSVTLDGSASSDYEDDASNTALTYTWSQLEGPPNIPVASETGEKVMFNAPVLGTGDVGNVKFRLTVTDSGDLHSTAECEIFIEDVTKPVFGNAGDRIEEATSPTGANVDYAITATDNVEGDVSTDIACVPPSGSAFLLDATKQVDCQVEDLNHNLAEVSFDVTVLDRTRPIIDAHEAIAEQAEGPGGTVIDYDAPGTFDVVDTALVATCAPPSGTEFAVGSHDVTCNATDASGNAALPTTFKVTIFDTLPPVVTVPADIEAEATSNAGAVVTFSASAFDIVDEAIAPTCAPASGSTFALGDTTVQCTATDAAGNIGSGSFKVTVEDTTAPVVTIEPPLAAEATSPAGAVVTFTATADDLVDQDVDAVCVPPSGSTFALGATVVNCTATDDSGNTGSGSVTVTVVDTTPPTIDAMDDIADVEATGPAGAVVTFTNPGWHDIVSGNGATTCLPASGSTFALGHTEVTCTGTDGVGNSAERTFDVEVVDTTKPALTLPANITEEATGPSGDTVTYSASANDLVSGNVAVSCTPASGSTFALGDTTVNCSATDAAGNTANGSFKISVVDTTAPSIAAHANVTAFASANSGANVAYTSPTATDIVDGNVAVTCLAASGTWFNVGQNTITCTAKDSRNNTATSTFKVIVSYNFSGFFRPVDNLPVANVVQAGQAIPVKFSLGGNQGLNIFTAGYPRVQVMSCATNVLQDTVEETVTAGSSSLQYQTSGEYHYVWKTDKAWAGTCRQLQLTFADGTTQSANFTFKK
jgi:hypothetical protein